MTSQDLLLKYPNIPKKLEEILSCPFYGCNGGNPKTPVWFCALEWGGGYEKNSLKPYDINVDCEKIPALFLTDMQAYLDGTYVDEYGEKLRPNGEKIYQVYVMLITAILQGKIDCTGLEGSSKIDILEKLEEQYRFFTQNGYGFLMNAYPLSMRKRQGADTFWTSTECVKTSKTSDTQMTLAEWTTIPTFDEYRKLSTALRREALSKLRKDFHPILIYCGGVSYATQLFEVWTTEEENTQKSQPCYFKTEAGRATGFDYKWVSNGEGVNPTLIAIGPFYSGYPSTLNDAPTCQDMGQKLREVLIQKIPNLDSALQPS